MTTFKQINTEGNIDLVIKKAGTSLALLLSRDFIKRFNLKYGDTIRLDEAVIIKV
jgi:antitoxin component of MazEF toxin-antitoxin module